MSGWKKLESVIFRVVDRVVEGPKPAKPSRILSLVIRHLGNSSYAKWKVAQQSTQRASDMPFASQKDGQKKHIRPKL